MLKKYDLPAIIKISNIKFDIDNLIDNFKQLESKFTDVVTANKMFCTNNPSLVKDVYSNFEQVTLMDMPSSKTPKLNLKGSKICDNQENKKLSKTQLYRLKSRKLTGEGGIDPSLDETNYNVPSADYKGSYFEKVIGSFKDKAIRARLTKLKAGTKITPHIDYDPSYATRIIIPIISNKKVINQFWIRGKYQEHYIKADGSAYFLNTGFRHGVLNESDEDRICLMFSLLGQEDILNLALNQS